MDLSMQEQKLRLEILKLRPDVAVLWLAAVYLLLTSFGGLLLFVYLMRHSFNPGGIAAGDTLSLAAIALGYLFFMAITLGVSTFAAFPFVRMVQPLLAASFRWLECKRLRRIHPPECPVPGHDKAIGSTIQLHWKPGNSFYLLVGMLFSLLLAVGFSANWSLPLIVYVTYMVAAGSLLCMLFFGEFRREYCRWPRFRDPSRLEKILEAMPLRKRQAVVVGTVIGVLSVLLVAEFQDVAFRIVGFRTSNVSIRMSKDDFVGLIDEATEAGIALNACKPLRIGTLQLHHVDVLLHKIGSSALLSYPSTPEFFDLNISHLSRRIRFGPLNSSFALMEQNAVAERCDELLLDSLFAFQDPHISTYAHRMLGMHLSRLAALAADEKVVVTILGGEDAALSLLRAQAIGSFLQREYGLTAASLSLIVDTTHRLKLECAAAPGIDARLCARVNHRVEIAVRGT